jgi:hypothetical protein
MSARSTKANKANAAAKKKTADSSGSSQAAAPQVDTAKSDLQMISASLRRSKDSTKAHAAAAKRRGKTSRADSTHSLDNENVHDRNDSARQGEATTRISRDSDLPETWVRPTALSAPPPRPGYVNRWVRFRAGSDEDKDNLDKFTSQGWRPIPKSKLRKDHSLTATIEGSYGQFIVKRGLILMELPEHLWQQRRKFYAQKQRRMTESIDRNLFKELDHRTPAWGVERRSSVSRTARRGRLEARVPGDE